MPAGRPSSYKPEYAEKAFKLCLLGATDERLANFFDVSVATVSNWKLHHPEFVEALKAGKDDADANVSNSLYQKAIGWETTATETDEKGNETVTVTKHPPDTTAAIFWLKNRDKEHWRDVKHNEHTVTHEISDQERIERLSRILGLEDAPTDRPDITH